MEAEVVVSPRSAPCQQVCGRAAKSELLPAVLMFWVWLPPHSTIKFRGDSGWILGKILRKSGEEFKQAAQGVVESLSLKVFKKHVDVALRDVVSGHGGDG